MSYEEFAEFARDWHTTKYTNIRDMNTSVLLSALWECDRELWGMAADAGFRGGANPDSLAALWRWLEDNWTEK